ncbi:hypothetical protein BAOM_2933 [Peribacillus asahii]|uniref:Uncharacterized protein n=1 Tax=Peribacillus asahii TaxID=228899 RepID=A0A3T0KSX8_9BACI|nr:hypothetical protein [Peribacillus asahii]AZV43542.1 hypothetical protein BAOM_2933 [Peribacillus asahii]
MLKKEDLDKRICDAEEGATNLQTFREFIESSESEFELIAKNLDVMSEKQLNEYLDFLDYLWEK